MIDVCAGCGGTNARTLVCTDLQCKAVCKNCAIKAVPGAFGIAKNDLVRAQFDTEKNTITLIKPREKVTLTHVFGHRFAEEHFIDLHFVPEHKRAYFEAFVEYLDLSVSQPSLTLAQQERFARAYDAWIQRDGKTGGKIDAALASLRIGNGAVRNFAVPESLAKFFRSQF